MTQEFLLAFCTSGGGRGDLEPFLDLAPNVWKAKGG